jgi:hypothetical protein
MMGQEFGLGDNEIIRLALQEIGNLLMESPSRASQQRLIRGLLDQCVLEYKGGMGQLAALVDELRRHQAGQFVLEDLGIERK